MSWLDRNINYRPDPDAWLKKVKENHKKRLKEYKKINKKFLKKLDKL